MNQRVQLRTSLRIAEDDLSENLAANPSIGGKDAIAKSLNHGFIYGLARLKQFVRDPVGIDEVASKLDEHYAHRALARGDAAREPDPEHQMARRMRAALSVFFMSIAIVIGPTPPGTGVIMDATSLTPRSSTSPAQT